MVPGLPGGSPGVTLQLNHLFVTQELPRAAICKRTCGDSLRDPRKHSQISPLSQIYPRYPLTSLQAIQSRGQSFRQSSPASALGGFYLQRWAGWYTRLVWPHQSIWELSVSRQIVPSWIICWPSLPSFHYSLPMKTHKTLKLLVFTTLQMFKDWFWGFFFQWIGPNTFKDFKINLTLKIKKWVPQKSRRLHRFVTQLC